MDQEEKIILQIKGTKYNRLYIYVPGGKGLKEGDYVELKKL